MVTRGCFIVLALLAAAPAAAQSAAPPGAVSCSGCHPPTAVDGIVVPPLNGREAAVIIKFMQDFRGGQTPSTVMDRLAKGFTEDEVKAIAAWFAAQR
jgi:cytochrome c553